MSAPELQSATRQDDPHEQEAAAVNLLDFAFALAENLRLLIVAPLLAGLIALAYSYTIPPTYTASTVFLPPQQQQSAASAMLQQLGALGGLAGAASALKNPADQYVAFMKSRAVRDGLIEQFALEARYEANIRENARKALDERTRISSGKDGLIRVEFDDHDPKMAAEVANAYVSQLSSLVKGLAVTEAQQRRAFFEKQLAAAKDSLTRAEQALKGSGISPLAIKGSPQAAVSAVAELQARISASEIRLGTMRGFLSEQAPEFKLVQDELAGLRAQLAKAARPDLSKGADADYIARFRDFKYFETLFELMARQYEIARIDESREGALIQVIDAAKPPEKKSKPHKALIAVIASAITGFFLFIWIVLRHVLRTSYQSNPGLATRVKDLRHAVARSLGFGKRGRQ